MKPELYTIFMASNRGTMRKFTVPSYALHLLTTLAVIGGISVLGAVGSYARLVWRVADYNALARKQNHLRQQYQQLETAADDADLRLSSLQSLATEVAMSYGSAHPRSDLFKVTELLNRPDAAFEDSVTEFAVLERNATAIGLGNGLRLASVGRSALSESFTPTLWPVAGQVTSYFGDRLNPFSGEGEFHTGVDISTRYGETVRATADGVVIQADVHAGYGRLLVIDHGFGVTTYYGHLASFAVSVGMYLHQGDAIGYVGVSGRTTGPHLHYEVRLNDMPVNPMRYLQHSSAAD
jgi:murein DD-endopeptidase MepM/ murein hydrolase activator NlpD